MSVGGLRRLLEAREQAGGSLRIGVIGAGKFATMFFSQALHLPGLHVLGIADLSLERTRGALALAGWPQERTEAKNFAEALERGTTYLTESGEELIKAEGLELVVEATGVPAAGITHALAAFDRGVHVVMVNVEADALVGPLLAERAAAAGVVYSLAYGDQPALICELVEWARACGFDLVSAGKGTKYLPEYHHSTPETVWDYYGFSQEMLDKGNFNPQMFNSFLDGTKSAIEMAAVANAAGLTPQPDGLRFPPAGAGSLAQVCRPEAAGGRLAYKGTVEVVSSLERDGRAVENDLRWGVFVTFEAPSDYVARCFAEYGLVTDETGRYTAMYKPYHLIGLELSVSVLRAGLLGEATGSPMAFRGDVVAVAKRDLRVGETLDGEGGYCVFGKLFPAAASLQIVALPIGLAHSVKLTREVKAGEVLRWSDVAIGTKDLAVRLRREMEARFVQP